MHFKINLRESAQNSDEEDLDTNKKSSNVDAVAEAKPAIPDYVDMDEDGIY